MSIEMDNPKTVYEKVDAAANYVEQIRIAIAVGDIKRANATIDTVGQLLFETMRQIEKNESATGSEA